MMLTRAERLRTVTLAKSQSVVPDSRPMRRTANPAIADFGLVASLKPEVGICNRDAAAAVGCDPFKSQVRLWMEKTGRQEMLHPTQLQDGSLSYWGRLLEPLVAAHYINRTGRAVRRVDAPVQHAELPWMLATVTREIVSDLDVQLLECLCVGREVASLWADGVPQYMRVRVMHLLAVTGQRAADVVVLLCGQDLQVYRIERDEREIARLIEQERAFWRGVELDRARPADDEEVLLP
jgi:putative phage-type endonuclease